MVRLCSDRDILKYEPTLFGANHPINQVIAAGTGGALAGTTFEASGANFVSAQVEAGDCIYLKSADGSLDGVYEIAAVDSATQVCVSVLRADSDGDPISPPVGTQTTGLIYRISTYKPQIKEADLFFRMFGVTESIEAGEILNSEEIKQLNVLGTIMVIYYSLAGIDMQNDALWDKAEHYERMFNKGMERVCIAIDKDGDGDADGVRYGGCGRLIRE